MTALLLVLVAATAGSARAAEESLIGSIVRSEKWTMKREPQKIEELTGSVVYEKERRRLRADWVRFNHDSGLLEARGGVQGTAAMEDGTRISVAGESARHERNARAGRLEPAEGREVSISVEAPGGAGIGRGAAGLLRWTLRGGEAAEISFERGVRFDSSKGIARAGRARYDTATGELSLRERRPTISAVEPRWAAAVQADEISAFKRPAKAREVVARGRVRGWIHFPEKDKYLEGR